MKGELNSFIIWEKTRKNTDEILQRMRKKFDIREIYEITWNPEKFPKNLRRFYGANLPKPLRKTSECGVGSFLLVLVIDTNPKHGMRRTSNGMQLVNTNIYDEKMKFRKMLSGEYPIHSAIHQKEVNHDLTMLLNKNINDVLSNLPEKWDGRFKEIKSDLVGTNGWKDLNELFYVLNYTTNYVILRNFEEFPEKIKLKEHKDIDILTDDLLQLPYVLDQRKSTKNEITVPSTVKIGGEEILFDIRYVRDSYYDEKWSKDILSRRILSPKGFYVPDTKDHFYSLLYHMIIHKSKLSNEYTHKLYDLASILQIKDIQKETFSDFDKLKMILDNYMKEMNYDYTDSFRYKIKHNELIRLYHVSRIIVKTEGINYLFRAIKGKLKRKVLVRMSNHE